MASRSPIHVGAERYGVPDTAADVEVVLLMLATLQAAGVESLTLDLGHVGIYRSLVAAASLPAALERRLFDALQRKAGTDLEAVLGECTQIGRASCREGGGISVVDVTGQDKYDGREREHT